MATPEPRSFNPDRPPPGSQSKAQWARPMPAVHRNIIPRQSWLAYNWIDKDPDLEFVLHCIEESGWTLEQIELATDNIGHKVSRYTLIGWFYKGVRRPQNATLNTVMSVIGWERPWTRRQVAA